MKFAKGLKGLMLGLALVGANAYAASPDLGTAAGPFSRIVSGLQEILDFLSGPVAIFILAASLIAAVVLWMFAPKEGALGGIVRVLAAGIMLVNIGLFVTYLVGVT
jgi:hypothetical protein